MKGQNINYVRGSISGRPLNVFTKAESAALFALCFALTFATFFVL